MIKAITEQTGAKIDISDDGTVSIASPDGEALKKAIAIIESLTLEPEIGTKYKGVVRRVENYGAFLEIAPGKDGLLHVTGKGQKDRLIPLSKTLLNVLRRYWTIDQPKDYLFPGRKPGAHLCASSVQRRFKTAKELAGISKKVSIHGLRHAYATHQLERGLPVHTLSVYLGHNDISTTLRYLHWVKESPVSCADLLQDIVHELPTFEESHHEPF